MNHTFGNKLNLAYSYKQGATKREYSNGDSQENEILNNEISNHSANIIYDLTKHPDDPEKNISLVYLRSTLDHSNEKYDEDLANINQMISLRYVGNIWKFNALNKLPRTKSCFVSFAWKSEDEVT